MEFKLYKHQEDAVNKLKSGDILYGGVGSGKSLTALSFYIKNYKDRPLYIITTAKKRDSNDWQNDMRDLGVEGTVDSWNNITKYFNINNAFYIFDEQRVVGYSVWGRGFIKIAKKNKWILLTATPGDDWVDYIPVFIANGFYRNKTDFVDQHIEYAPYVSFPLIKAYHNVGKLIQHRDDILMHMPMVRHTTRHRKLIFSNYDKEAYDRILKERWNIYENEPIKNASELLQCLRKVVGTDPDKRFNAKVLMDIHDRLVVFYNYNYELDILKEIATELGKEYYQWNGKAHEEIPDTEQWLYFVQYTAGSEGWNCTSTDVMMFYSLNYSYRMMEQAEGRIDRLNTPFSDLEYYLLTTNSKMDRDVYKTIIAKKKFNKTAWAKRSGLTF